MHRYFSSLLLLLVLPSCSWFSGIFSAPQEVNRATALHAAAMADYSLCETAPTLAERQQAAARLAQTAMTLSAQTLTDPALSYEADRAAAASARCEASLDPTRDTTPYWLWQ